MKFQEYLFDVDAAVGRSIAPRGASTAGGVQPQQVKPGPGPHGKLDGAGVEAQTLCLYSPKPERPQQSTNRERNEPARKPYMGLHRDDGSDVLIPLASDDGDEATDSGDADADYADVWAHEPWHEDADGEYTVVDLLGVELRVYMDDIVAARRVGVPLVANLPPGSVCECGCDDEDFE